MRRQQTLARQVSCGGIGLHGGAPVQLSLLPAAADTGIVFECPGGVTVPACLANVVAARRATTLAAAGARVGTVEHLLAALYGLGVDNARVRVDGDELPAMDGSAAAFVYLVRAAGIAEQAAPLRVLRLRRPLEVRDGAGWIRARPARELHVSCSIDFAHPAIGRQAVACRVDDPRSFEREIAPARTFGFLREVEALREAGLARGGSLANTLVLDGTGVVNPEGLRMPGELARHKALDLVGDLALLGARLLAHVVAHRAGHALHHRLVGALLDAQATRRRWRPTPRRAALSPSPAPGPVSAGPPGP